MMHPSAETLRWYTNDLIAAHRHVAEAMRRNQSIDALRRIPGAAETVDAAVATLDKHLNILERRTEQLGGPGAVGAMKETLTTITGFFTGLYGHTRPEAASRALRDDLVALNFVMTCASMLHTTARALNDTTTAEITHTIMRDLPPLILRLTDLLPAAVLQDLAKDNPGVNTAALQQTIVEIKTAWRGSSAAQPTPG